MRSTRTALTAVLLASAAFSLAACQQMSAPASSGEPATWHLADPTAVTADSEQIDIEVTRLGCASGTTGEVLEPQVTYEAEQILIRVDVAPVGGGPQSCPGNDAVRISVALTEPLGSRALVDGGCALEGVGTTAECAETAIRFDGV